MNGDDNIGNLFVLFRIFDTFEDRFVIEVLFFFFECLFVFFGVGKIRPFCSVVFRIAPADDIYVIFIEYVLQVFNIHLVLSQKLCLLMSKGSTILLLFSLVLSLYFLRARV